MDTYRLKTSLLEASALPEIDHLLNLPDEFILDQMEAHKADFLSMCGESIRNDPLTPDYMLEECFKHFCIKLEKFHMVVDMKTNQ